MSQMINPNPKSKFLRLRQILAVDKIIHKKIHLELVDVGPTSIV